MATLRNASTGANHTRLQRSVSELEREVQVLRFTVQTLALRTPHCGPGQSASEAVRESFIHGQEQLDALIVDYEQAIKDLWAAKLEQGQPSTKQEQQQKQQQRRMTIS